MSKQEGYKIIDENDDRVRTYSYTHDGVEYILKDVWDSVVDAYDEYLGSVEISHVEVYNFCELEKYLGTPNVIDLKWLHSNDIIRLNCTPELRKIYLNSKNAKGAHIHKADNGHNFDIDMTINSSFWHATKELKSFMDNNFKKINSVNLRNVPNEIFKIWATKSFAKTGIEISFDEEMVKTR